MATPLNDEDPFAESFAALGQPDDDPFAESFTAMAAAPKQSRKDQILARLSRPERAFAESAPTAFRAYTGMRSTVDQGGQILDRLLPDEYEEAIKKGISATSPIARAALFANTPEDRQARDEAAAELDEDKGVDWIRMAGAVADPAAWVAGTKAFQGASGLVQNAPKIVKALAPSMAAGGALSAASIPTDEGLSGADFLKEKGKQALIGTISGAVIPAAGWVLGRVISPKTSQNAQLKALQAGGVKPTIGQALGGSFNAMEEKLQVVPFFGDMITRARGMARKDFNKMVINEVTAPLGVKVDKIGQEGIQEAGDLISKHYDDVLSGIQGVKFDDDFAANIGNLKNMSEYMFPDEQQVFSKVLKDVVGSKMSPAGGMEAKTLKQVDSRIGKLAKNHVGTDLGDALRELQSLLRDQVSRSNPDKAKALDAANAAWAKLVRLEQAGKASANQGGVFTPAQLMGAVKKADKSVRGRAVARGEALMQETAEAGQNVLGNKYPDSGTAGRLMAGGLGAGAAYIDPLLIAGMGTGAGLYTRPVQNAFVNMVSSRPDLAPKVAGRLNALASGATPARISGLTANRLSDK